MPATSGRDASFRVEFDDATLTEDLAHNAPGGRTAAEHARQELTADGLPTSLLKACEDTGRDGTHLPSCAKLYLPAPAGLWGMVFQLRLDSDQRPFLACLAFGVRHPTGPGQLSVYQVAHRRLSG
jgi:hypothetical protein